MIILKSSRELALMRQAGRIVAQVHERFREVVVAVVSVSSEQVPGQCDLRQQRAIIMSKQSN